MSTVKANNHQIGQSGTASQNFTLYQPSTPDGTVRLAVGNSGATTGDVLSVSSTGLSVTGTLTSTGVNTFPAGSASAPSITTTGDTNTGLYFPAADTIAFTEGGAEAMRIDSSGRLLVGTTSTKGSGMKLQVVDDGTANIQVFTGRSDVYGPSIVYGRSRGTTASPTIVQANDGLGELTFRGYDGASYVNGASIEAQVDGTPGSNDMPGRLVFFTAADGTASTTERMRINSDGTIKTGSTISVGGATPSTSGAGITFPATQSASSNANTLDDYEEGTWTPSLGGTTTYTQQDGIYTKIGNLVTVSFQLKINTIGTGSGFLITGLPFTQTSTGSLSCSGSCGYFESLNTSVVSINVRTDSGQAYIVMASLTAASAAVANNTIFKNSTYVAGTVTYQVA